jgi:hypothetical protein
MNFKADILPHLVAVVVFALATIIFYNPVFFENKRLEQHDVVQGIGGGKELIDYREKTGKEGLWANAMFSGMPAYLINTQWSGDLLQHVQRFLSLGLKAPARYIFWAMISFYILLLSFRIRPYLAIGGAIAFGFSSFIVIGISAGHVWRIVGMAFMPLVIAGVHLTFHNRRWMGLALTALGLGLQIRSNHLQMTYYLLIIILLYGLFFLIKAIREKTFKTFMLNALLLLVPVILAVGSNFGKIWSIMEYSKYSIRGKSELTQKVASRDGLDNEYAFQYSNGIFEPLMLMIPNIMGGASQQKLDRSSNLAKALERNGLQRKQIDDQLKAVPTYWGNLPVTAPYYAGVIIVFIFVLSMFTKNAYLRNWGLTIFILSVVLSWGSNFQSLNYFLFDHLPGYNKFRSVTFTITMAFIVLPLLGFIGLEEFLRNKENKKYHEYLKYTVYITGGILLLALLYSWVGNFRGAVDERLGNLPDWFLQALRRDRARLLRMDVIRNVVFLTLFVLTLWRLGKQKLNLNAAYIIIIVLIGLDITLVSSRYLSDNSFVRNTRNEILTPTAADQKILSDPDLKYRVLNLQNPFNEARTSYFHHSIGGYHGAKIRRYQDVIENHISVEINQFIERYQQGGSAFQDLPVLSMLNAKYFYVGSDVQGVFQNPYVSGNAWFVQNVIEVNSPDEEIARIGTIDPDSSCVVDIKKFNTANNTYPEGGTIRLTDARPDYLKYETSNSSDGFAVFSEVYYPEGWSASINGEWVEIKRVNYILRALDVPAGNNIIEFAFEPASYYVGNKISFTGSLLTLLVFVAFVWLDTKSTSNVNKESA